MSVAPEVVEEHVLVVAAEEDRPHVGPVAEVEQAVDGGARVGTAVDVVADEDDRVAGGRGDRGEDALELADAPVQVADREGPPRHRRHRLRTRPATAFGSSRMRSAAL